jgi:hypothetical protein
MSDEKTDEELARLRAGRASTHPAPWCPDCDTYGLHTCCCEGDEK